MLDRAEVIINVARSATNERPRVSKLSCHIIYIQLRRTSRKRVRVCISCPCSANAALELALPCIVFAIRLDSDNDSRDQKFPSTLT